MHVWYLHKPPREQYAGPPGDVVFALAFGCSIHYSRPLSDRKEKVIRNKRTKGGLAWSLQGEENMKKEEEGRWEIVKE